MRWREMLRVSHFSPRVSRYSRPHRRDLTGWARKRPRRKNPSPTIPELKKRVTYVTLFADVQWAKRFCFGGDWRNAEEKIRNEANRALEKEPGGFAGGFPAISLGRFRIRRVWRPFPAGRNAPSLAFLVTGLPPPLYEKNRRSPEGSAAETFPSPAPHEGAGAAGKLEVACYTAPTVFNAST